jgi:RecA/RadA recombinase
MTNVSNSSSSRKLPGAWVTLCIELTRGPDRLPTISASEALQNASSRSSSIPTGLPTLDSALQPNRSLTSNGGLPCGSVTEIYGPPGVGKTAFAIQAAVHALHASPSRRHVVWIDTGAPLPGPRFQQVFAAHMRPKCRDPSSSPPVPESADSLLDNVSYFSVPTLAHLLTLFLHPTSQFPPPRTSLIVVDNVSAPFATAFPRTVDRPVPRATLADSARNAAQQRAANRKWAVGGDLAAAMAKMAILQNAAVLAVNQVATSLKGVRRAVLKPSLAGNGWEAGVGNRVLLYRDFAPKDESMALTDHERRGMRFAAAVKVGGKTVTGDVVPFVIEDVGFLVFACLFFR